MYIHQGSSDPQMFLAYEHGLGSIFSDDHVALGGGPPSSYLNLNIPTSQFQPASLEHSCIVPLSVNARYCKPWHSAHRDKLHRQDVVREIMRLLLNRKEGPTSPRWLSQLPHKALKLEQRLYSASVSLGAYRDRNTLRLRLQTVATSIMQKHLQTKRTKLADDREPKRVVAGHPKEHQASMSGETSVKAVADSFDNLTDEQKRARWESSLADGASRNLSSSSMLLLQQHPCQDHHQQLSQANLTCHQEQSNLQRNNIKNSGPTPGDTFNGTCFDAHKQMVTIGTTLPSSMGKNTMDRALTGNWDVESSLQGLFPQPTHPHTGYSPGPDQSNGSFPSSVHDVIQQGHYYYGLDQRMISPPAQRPNCIQQLQQLMSTFDDSQFGQSITNVIPNDFCMSSIPVQQAVPSAHQFEQLLPPQALAMHSPHHLLQPTQYPPLLQSPLLTHQPPTLHSPNDSGMFPHSRFSSWNDGLHPDSPLIGVSKDTISPCIPQQWEEGTTTGNGSADTNNIESFTALEECQASVLEE